MLGTVGHVWSVRSFGPENPNHSYGVAGIQNLSKKFVYREKDDAETWRRQRIMWREEKCRIL